MSLVHWTLKSLRRNMSRTCWKLTLWINYPQRSAMTWNSLQSFSREYQEKSFKGRCLAGGITLRSHLKTTRGSGCSLGTVNQHALNKPSTKETANCRSQALEKPHTTEAEQWRTIHFPEAKHWRSYRWTNPGGGGTAPAVGSWHWRSCCADGKGVLEKLLVLKKLHALELRCWRSCPCFKIQVGRSHPCCRSKVWERPFTLHKPVPLLHPLQTKLNLMPSGKREIFIVLLQLSLATWQWGLCK